MSRMRNEPRQRHGTAARLAYHATRKYRSFSRQDCSEFRIWVPTRRVVLYAANDVSEEHAASVFGLQDVCYTGRLSRVPFSPPWMTANLPWNRPTGTMLSLCLTKQALGHEGVWGNEYMNQVFFNSAPVRGKWSVSRPGRFTAEENAMGRTLSAPKSLSGRRGEKPSTYRDSNSSPYLAATSTALSQLLPYITELIQT
jgi:hypothetical protein